MSKTRTVAVIGAGISGLSAAYWLRKNGFDVTVFEKTPHIGGTIITEREGGFLADLGPNSTLETSEILRGLVRDLGIEGEKIYGSESSNKRYIVRGGELHAVPMSPLKFLRTRLFSSKAKLRLIREPFIKPTNSSEISLADFVRHRLGAEFLDFAVNPFVAGVYAGDPETLSTPAAFPKLYALEQKYGSLIKGAIKGAKERKKRKEVGKDRARLFSFRDGMETFPRALAAQLENNVVLETEVLSIRREDSFFLDIRGREKNEQKRFDLVVISVPTDSIARILENIYPDEASRLDEVEYPPVAVVFQGFKSADVKRRLDGFGFLVPKLENRQILGSIWSSSLFPNRAPEGHVALTTFVGGTRQPRNASLDDTQLQKIVYNDLNELVGLNGKPVFERIKRWPRAIPQYKLGYQKYQAMFDTVEDEFPGLYFAGNFRRGISIGDSVVCAWDTVQKIMNRRGSDSSTAQSAVNTV